MSLHQILLNVLGASALALAGVAQATTIDITAGNGFNGGSSLCKNASVVGVTVGAGLELTGADWFNGCVGTYSVDVSANSITLTGLESGNYSYASLQIHFASGPAITSASFSGYTPDFFQSDYPQNDGNFAPVVTFDADDIFIVWDTSDDSSQFAFNAPANGGSAPFGTATIQFTTAAVPEPQSLMLSVAGLGVVGVLARRRQQKAARRPAAA